MAMRAARGSFLSYPSFFVWGSVAQATEARRSLDD